MSLIKFVKGTVAQYTSNKSTYDVDGTIFVATDKPYVFIWGQKIGVDASDLFTVEGKDAILVEGDDERVVSLKIAATNKVLSQSTDGLTTTLKFVEDAESKKIKLVGIDNAEVASFDYAKFVVDGMLETVEYNKEDPNKLDFTWNTSAGSKKMSIDLSKYIDTYTSGDGITVEDKEISVKVKDNDKYLEVTKAGVASKGIDEAIAEVVDTIDSLDKETIKEIEVNGVEATVAYNKATVVVDSNDIKVTKTGTGTLLNTNGVIKDNDTVKTAIATLESALIWKNA